MKTISTKQFEQKLKQANEELHIIDVREQDEYDEGHIAGSKHIPMSEFFSHLPELDPNKHYYLVCRSGRRSGIIGEQLTELGYRVTNVDGGLLEWDGELSDDE